MKRCTLAVMMSVALAACGGDEIIDTSKSSKSTSKSVSTLEAAGLYGGQHSEPLVAILNDGRYYVVSFNNDAIALIYGTESDPLGKGGFSSVDAKFFGLVSTLEKSKDIDVSAELELDKNSKKKALKITSNSELSSGLKEIKGAPYNPDYEQKNGIGELAAKVFRNEGATTFLASEHEHANQHGHAHPKGKISDPITLAFTKDGSVTYVEEQHGSCSATGKVSEIAGAGHVYDISLKFENKTPAHSCAYDGQKLLGVVIYTPHKRWKIRTLLTNEAGSEAMVLMGKPERTESEEHAESQD